VVLLSLVKVGEQVLATTSPRQRRVLRFEGRSVHGALVRLHVLSLVRRVPRHDHGGLLDRDAHVGKTSGLVHGLQNVFVVDSISDLFLFEVVRWLRNTDGSVSVRGRCISTPADDMALLATEALGVLSLALQDALVSNLLELLMELFDDLFSFSHDGHVAGVHIVLLEELLTGQVLLLECLDLLDLGEVFKFKLGDQLLELGDFTGRLLGLQLDDKIFKLLDSLDKPLRVQSNRVSIHLEVVVFNALSEAHEVLEFSLKFLELILNFLVLLLNVLIVVQQVLLFFVHDSHLLDQVLSRLPFVLLSLQPCQPLVGLQELSLILLHDQLVLLPRSLKLEIVPIDLLLQVKVLLKQLVPLPLTDCLPLLQLLRQPLRFEVLLRQIFKEI
jgi:hypothetical protein